MPLIRRTVSPVGLEIVGPIKDFIQSNATAVRDDGSVEVGCEMLANAIAFGIAKALSSSALSTSVSTIVNPPATAVGVPVPIGPLMAQAMAGVTRET